MLIAINLFGKQAPGEAPRSLAAHGYGAVDFSAVAGRMADVPAELSSLRNLARDVGLTPETTHYRSFGFSFLGLGEAREQFLRCSVNDVRAAALLGARLPFLRLSEWLLAHPAAVLS